MEPTPPMASDASPDHQQQLPNNGLPQPSPTGGASQPPQASFRRQRASRACETCHARKVRCDAASLGVPCTNCTAFGIECRIPTPKRKKTSSKNKDEDEERADSANTAPFQDGDDDRHTRSPTDGDPLAPPLPGMESIAANTKPAVYMRPKFARAPIKEAGRVAYLGESSNLSLLVHDREGSTDVVHYPLPENVRGAKARVNELDNMEIEILHQRGAFLLPPRALCDELVEAFFKWVAPVVPVINRSRFMRQYRDQKNPPSLLLLQAVLLAGSRVCSNPQLMDSSGSTTPAAMTFYKRAKALYDANYEDDRVTIVQSAVLMGWYWEGPEDVTKNVFYWTRIAIAVAQGSGMHRSVESSQLSRSDKRLWKRIWWTLFSRDRSVAVALGRPVAVNPDDSDVEMITEDDFVEDELDRPAEYPHSETHIHFFINYVKLCEIMGLVLSQQYSVASKFRRNDAIDLTHSDMALADWLQHCPQDVQWDKSRHNFWAALLHANYYTTLCLLHRAHMPPAGSSPKASNGFVEEAAYPSRTIAYHAAGMITSIMDQLVALDELRYAPAFVVYSLFSALIMHVYQMRSSNRAIVTATEGRLQVCMHALKEVSRVWLVAKMVHTLFDSILGNKHLEERLQKAAGKRHQKNKQPAVPPQMATQMAAHLATQMANPRPKDDALKRKFDDMELQYASHPAPQVSYERSRPQTPAMTPSRELPHQQQQAADAQQMPTISANSPHMARQNGDAFMGPSRNQTRPTTPFNPSYSFPGTPPDLFLHTRNSPNISQEIWQNFQPENLFPSEANVTFPQYSSLQQQNSLIDPALNRTHSGQNIPMQQSMQQSPVPGQQPMHSPPGGTMQIDPNIHQQFLGPWGLQNGMGQQQQQQQQQQQPPQQQHPQPDTDTWSNSSSQNGPYVPTALNVEDWFNFFGIQGDASQLAAFQ